MLTFFFFLFVSPNRFVSFHLTEKHEEYQIACRRVGGESEGESREETREETRHSVHLFLESVNSIIVERVRK